jgi:hypothetical protein
VILAAFSSSPATVVPSNVPTRTSESGTYWPTEAWRTSTPEEQGMDPQKLAQMLVAIQEQHLSLHSLLIIRNGYLVSETYFEPYRPDTDTSYIPARRASFPRSSVLQWIKLH